MTTRSRSRWVRAAAWAGLTGAMLAVPAAPVAAAPAPIRILSVSAENVEPGDKVRVRFRVTNTGKAAEPAIVVVGGGLRCATGCRAEPTLAAGRSRDLEATLVAPAAGPGEVSGLNISVAVRLGGQNSYDFTMVYVHGKGASPTGTGQAPAEVKRVSGRVRDSGGKAVGGASLTLRDKAGHEYRTTSDRSGRFAVTSTARKPITAGAITVIATKDGYDTARTTARGAAGDTVAVRLTLPVRSAPPTTSPAPEVSASPLAIAGNPLAATPPAHETVSDDSGGSLPFKLLGGLLVAVGLGTLALVVLRRRKPLSRA